MQKKLRLFIQEYPDGSVHARATTLPHVQAFAENRAAALAMISARLDEYFKNLSRAHWGRVNFYPQEELRPLEVPLVPKGKASKEPLATTVSLLVSTDTHKKGTRYILTAPLVDGFHIVVGDPGEIEDKARDGLQAYLRKWTSQQIIELDRVAVESLEPISLELPDEEAAAGAARAPSNDASEDDVLGLCGLKLNDQAAAGRLGRADRREALVEQMLTTLAADRMSSVMLVGGGDVGKTAILHEVVERIRAGAVPDSLKQRELWFVTANNLIAGMKYTGEWQGRTQKLIAQARKGRQILYMADPNEILDAGRWEKSDNNMGRFLRPYIDSGEITLICECSPEGFEVGLKVEPSFMNAFTRIDVKPTDEADTQAIVQATGRRLEAARNVSVEPSANAAVLDLTRRFMPYRAFPGKAVRFLEDMVRDALPGQERSPTVRTLSRADAINSFTRATGLPALILSDEVAMRDDEVRAYFEERLLGQPDGVEAMVDLITVIKAGLNDPQKPLGSFFFVGPTGVGKTELAKVLAEFLFGSRDRMIRFDMSEYSSADALPRLIGTAWKRDNEGELTRRVREQPFCVVLFDELEKAHPDVFDILLGVLGEGRLTDAGGRTADFRNAIIIMTSNLGASRREMQTIGFGGQSAPADADANQRLVSYFVKEAEQFFRPEFFNRIDRIVAFRPLSVESIRLITRRELGKLLMREGIVRRNLLVEIDDAVIEKLLERGFHPLYGARPLQREIERMVILPLARLLLNQGADQSHLLRFSVRDEQIHLSFVAIDTPEDSALEAPPPPAPDRKLETDLSAVQRAIRELRERCEDEEATPAVKKLRREVSALLSRTNEPRFWDEPASARQTLSRVYHLERVLKRLDGIGEQAEFLEEKGRLIRIHRDRRSVPGLSAEAEALSAELAYVQMELAAAGAGQGRDRALVRVTALGRDAEGWVGQLVGMYRAWAARKGYEEQSFDPRHGLGAAYDLRAGGAFLALYVQGSNVYEFLRHEAGIHRLNLGEAESRQRHLARVSVILVPDAPAADDPEQLRGLLAGLATASSDEDSAVARVYHQGRYRFVRDPRTGERATNVAAVLEQGEIDAFLLASLRQLVSEPAGA